MEVLELSAYSLSEKLHIAREHLLPRQLDLTGLPPSFISLPDSTLATLIEGYTREAGLRNLEREIASVCRAVAVRYASLADSAAREAAPPTTLSPSDLATLIGPRRYDREALERLARPGIAFGLAWTAAGGELLFIETSRMAGTGQLLLTGQLGEVMQESVQTALSWIRSHTRELGLGATAPAMAAAAARAVTEGREAPEMAASTEASLLEGVDIHVHFPAGAIRKDGPSAGATTLVALVSLFTGRCARSDTAMTGEISLRGNVLPVGGVREKVLAAHRAGVKRVLLPHQNRKDISELPEMVCADVELVWCATIAQLLAAALEQSAVDGEHSPGDVQASERDVRSEGSAHVQLARGLTSRL